MSSTCHLTNIPSNEHIMLLYSRSDERNNAAVNYINNGNLSSKIEIIKKILKVVNFKLLILSLIMNQHYIEIYLLLTS